MINNPLDLFIVGIVLVGGLLGMLSGAIRLAVPLALLVAISMIVRAHPEMTSVVEPSARPFLAVAGIVIGLFVFGVLVRAMGAVVHAAGLRPLDRFLGLVLGLALGSLLAGAAVWLIQRYGPPDLKSLLATSQFAATTLTFFNHLIAALTGSSMPEPLVPMNAVVQTVAAVKQSREHSKTGRVHHCGIKLLRLWLYAVIVTASLAPASIRAQDLAGVTVAIDARLKTNIQTLSDDKGLAAIMKLNPVTFNWIDTESPQSVQTGFVAQEVKEVIPEAVSSQGETTITLADGSKKTVSDTLGVSPTALIPHIVKAVQEQQAEIEELKQIVCTDHPNAKFCPE